MSNEPKIYWTARSNNGKTGDIPQAFIGETEEITCTTCKKVECPLLPHHLGGTWFPESKRKAATVNQESELVSLSLELDEGCYAWYGQSRKAFWAIRRAATRIEEKLVELRREKPSKRRDKKITQLQSRYTLQHAIDNSHRKARMVRFTAIGDGGVVGKDTMEGILKVLNDSNMLLYGFTRGWGFDYAQHWKGKLMASCMNLEEVDEAVDKGWRASTVLPADFKGTGRLKNKFTTPKGRVGIVCPYQMGKATDCNSCGLCVASKTGPVIGFISHK